MHYHEFVRDLTASCPHRGTCASRPDHPCDRFLHCGFILGVLLCEAFVTCLNGRSMTDQTLGLPARKASNCPAALHRSATAATYRASSDDVLGCRRADRRGADAAISGSTKATFPNILFTAAVTLALIAFLVLLTRRVLFATALVASLVVLIVAISSVKRAVMNMVVHAYDIFFYLSSWSTVSYLWSDQRRYLVGLVGALLGVAAAAWLAYRADGTRVPRRWAALALPLCVALAWYGADAKGERRHMQFYYENLYVSSFYASWGETLETLWRGALLEAAPRAAAAGAAFSIPTSCDVGGQAAAHHPDPRGIGGAAVAVPDAALRPLGRPLLPLLRRSHSTGCGWRPMAAPRG